MTTTPADLRAMLRRGNLTGKAAAAIAGVNPRTIRRWIGGDSEVPYSAWRLLEAYVEQEEMVAEATADHAAWEAALDADTAAKAPLAALEERIWTLKGIQQVQHQRCCHLEDDLGEARRELAETSRTLNALCAERGRMMSELSRIS